MNNQIINQAVILAGGFGTRLKPFTDTMPKSLYPINNIPFIDYLINQVKSFGIDNILILLGYLPEKITNYLGNGSRYGVNITYDIAPLNYETGARLKHAISKIYDKFLLLYCDNYCPIDYSKLLNDFCNNNSKIQITAYSNRDNYTKSNLKLEKDGRVAKYDKRREEANL